MVHWETNTVSFLEMRGKNRWNRTGPEQTTDVLLLRCYATVVRPTGKSVAYLSDSSSRRGESPLMLSKMSCSVACSRYGEIWESSALNALWRAGSHASRNARRLTNSEAGEGNRLASRSMP